MTRSSAELKPGRAPRPVGLGRYRYSKLRWRLSVRALDILGGGAMRVWRTIRPLPTLENPRRILVVQLDHLGDAVLTSPLLSRLRLAYPEARVDVLASPSNFEVFEADPNVDRVHLATKTWFERRRGRWAMLSAVWALGRLLQREEFDLGIDVRGDILTVLVLTLARIPRRVGWSMGGGGFLLTDLAAWVPGRHEVHSRLALLGALGIPPEDPPRVEIHIDDEDRLEVARRLADAWPGVSAASRREAWIGRRGLESRARTRLRARHVLRPDDLAQDVAGPLGVFAPLVAVHLGAGTAAKRWPLASWKTLIGRFLDEGWRVAVVGGPEDEDASRTLEPHANLRDWAGGFTVSQTAALLERADLFVGADSGPSHLAACAGVPSVVLFSGTNRPGQWRPWSRRSLVLRHSVPCRPCHQKTCPLADHPCMTGLAPERVYRAARRWWARLQREESPRAPQ
jgi:ADP-heptose:LPS heptosyltransferase